MTTETSNQEASLMARLGPVAIGRNGFKLESMDDVFRFAKAVALSQLCPQGFNETDCFVIIANGYEVGMSPMAALASTYVVNNRATIFGDMPLALVRQSGLLENYEQEYLGKEYDDDFRCVVTTKRKGAAKPMVTSYSVADAKRAELWGKMSKDGNKKTPWVTAPQRMLLFRARAFNLRDNFGDVLKGCAIGELNDDFGEEPGFSRAKTAEGRIVEPNLPLVPAPAETPKRWPGRPKKDKEPGPMPELIKEAPGTPSGPDDDPTLVELGGSAKSAPEAKSEPPRPLVEQLKAKLTEAKRGPQDFVLLLRRFALLEAEIPMEEIPDSTLQLALDDWPSILQTLHALVV